MADDQRPQYGEMAPEGWEWHPEGEQGEAATGAANGSQPASAKANGPITGVPHNLGAPRHEGSASGAPGTTTGTPAGGRGTGGDPEPYRASAPAGQRTPASSAAPQYSQAPQYAQYAQGQQPGGPKRANSADRVITIILLVLGAMGALYFALAMQQLPMSVSMIAEALEISDFVLPGWVNTVGIVSALGYLALYAVSLIWSIQRLRARKLAFWIPLTAGVISVIALFVISMSVFTGVPGLMQALSDPESTSKLMSFMSSLEQ